MPDSSLRASFIKLMRDPTHLGAQRLWRAMTADEHELALLAALHDERNPPALRAHLVARIAQAKSFREATVRLWEDAKLAKWGAKLNLRDRDLVLSAIVSFHLSDRAEMLSEFLDALSIPNERGRFINDAVPNSPIDPARLAPAADGLLERFAINDVVFYLLALRSEFATAFAGLDQWFAKLGNDARPAEPTGEPEPTDEQATGASLPEADSDGFTGLSTLDRLLIARVVDTAGGVIGAESLDEIDDLLLELEQLNGRRHATFFHAGFRDALFDRDPAASLSAENEGRRRWYWAGLISGFARKERWSDIVMFFDSHPAIRSLGETADGPSVLATPLVFRALLEAGRFGEAAAFAQEPMVGKSRALRRSMLDTAVRLIRDFRAADALPFLDRLSRVAPNLSQEDDAAEQRFTVEVERRRALCLRQLGDGGSALSILRQLAASQDTTVSAIAHTDIGLIQAGVRRLGDIRLPKLEGELDQFIADLVRGAAELRQAAATKGFSPAHANFALGVLALAEGAKGIKDRFEEAAHRLDGALAFFDSNREVYRADGTLGLAQLYLGAALCLGLEDYGRLPRAKELLALGLDAGATIPVWLVRSTIDSLAAVRADLAVETASVILERCGDSVLDELVASDAAPESEAVRLSLFRRAGSASRPTTSRVPDYRTLLPWLIRAEEIEKASHALEYLEAAALDDIGREEFTKLLSVPASLSPAWDVDRVSEARTKILEVEGRFVDAATELEVACQRLLALDAPNALDSAALLLDHIESYGAVASENTDRLRPIIEARLKRRDADDDQHLADETNSELAHVAVQILIVGGAEMQSKMDEDIKAAVRKRLANVSVEFLHTGWGSNWNTYVGQFEKMASRADGVVFLQHMRTMFGRTVRSKCHLPWRACRGSGNGQIVNTVMRVVPHAREHLLGQRACRTTEE